MELIARNTELAQGSVKFTASAANIATLSLKLSEAFFKAEEEATLARVPVKKHTLEGDDIASWTKSPAAAP